MLTAKLDLLTQLVLEQFDQSTQDLILCEEMSELTKALLKLRRIDKTSPCYKSAVDNAVEETAHVIISICVVCKILHISEFKLEEEVVKKLQEYTEE